MAMIAVHYLAGAMIALFVKLKVHVLLLLMVAQMMSLHVMMVHVYQDHGNVI